MFRFNPDVRMWIKECECKNIGLVNHDWLCLDCGDKVEPPKEH